MINFFLVLFLLFSTLLAKEYPHSFSQLGTPLYKSVEPFERYKDIKLLKSDIIEYSKCAKRDIEYGFKVDESHDNLEKKEYLLKLRKLQKKHDYLLHLVHNAIDKSIEKQDYELFLKLTSYEFDGLLKNSNLRNKSLIFYNKNSSNKKSKFLDKKIKQTKLIETTQEFYNQVIKATYSSNSKSITSKKSVVMSASREGKYIFISIKNKNYYDVTLKVNARYKNVQELQDTPNVIVVKAKSTLLYTKLILKSGKSSYRYSYRWIVGNKDAVHDDDYIYRLPYAIGSAYRVSQGFNGKVTHKGRSKYAIDFAMKRGTKIHAAREGVVVRTKSNSNKGGFLKKYSSYGNYVTISHSDGTLATYYHLKYKGVSVKLGQKVDRGEHIGYSGNTGYTSGPHLHMSVFSAISSSATHTIAIKFISSLGIVNEPIRGTYYKAK